MSFKETATLVVLIVAVFIAGCAYKVKTESEYMEQCMNDGHKEYECYGLIRGNK